MGYRPAIKAREVATQTTIDLTNITPKKNGCFSKSRTRFKLSGALSRLLVKVEKHPELKVNQNFLNLQSQLEGEENRINVERNRFNNTVNAFAKHIKKFPNNILNGLWEDLKQ